MKKIVFTAVSALALAAFADGVNSTEFGVICVPSTNKETIVSVPWLESGTGDAAVSVSNLVLTAGLSEGDTLSLYSGTNYVASWNLNAQKKWVSDQSKITTLPRGNAIMLKRANPSGDFYIMGKPTTDSATTTLATGYSLVAPPSTDANGTDVNDNITWTGVASDDVLRIPISNGTKMVQLIYTEPTESTTVQWCEWDKSTKKYVKATTKIPMGLGAWFVTKDGTGKSFTYPKTAQ